MSGTLGRWGRSVEGLSTVRISNCGGEKEWDGTYFSVGDRFEGDLSLTMPTPN